MSKSVGTAVGAALIASAAGGAQFDSNGTTIHYTMAGSGEPVVLIHGFLGSRDEWLSPPPFLPPEQQESFEPAFETLSKDFKTIALDCRGHGRSDKPHGADAYGNKMVEDIVRLLDHLELEEAHVVGYSMGAFIAAKLVALYPDRVTSVVLGGGGALLEGSEPLAFMESLGRSLESGRGVEPLIRSMTPPGQSPPSAEEINEANRMFLAGQDEGALAQVALGLEEVTVSTSTLSSNDVPALLIVGGDDPLRASSEETQRLMMRSRVVVLPGLDHVSAELSPDFARTVRSFLLESR